MKIEVFQEELIKGIGVVGRVVSNRAQLAVLGNILIEAQKTGLRLSGTDLQIGMSIGLPAKVSETGRITVPAKVLQEFVGSLAPGRLTLELKQDTLIVEGGSYRGKFQTISAEEFPAIPVLPDNKAKIIVRQSEFAEMSTKVIFAAAKDSLRPVLTGILLELSKTSLRMVATDGFRLSVGKIKAQGADSLRSVLIPMQAIAEVARFEGEEELQIVSVEESNQVIFQAGESLLVSQVIDGNYPDYNKIIPKESKSEVVVNREELLQAVRVAHIFARENSNMMKWDVNEKEIVIIAESPERGDSEARVPAKIDGEGGKIIFNAKFLLDFLSVAKGSEITFGMGEPLDAGVFRSIGDEGLLYIVMPINA